MTADEREWIVETLNTLPFVRWDRLAGLDEGAWLSLCVYGWIDREDGRSDFVVLTFDDRGLSFVTSSAERHDEINTRLGFGAGGDQCRRVEDVLGSDVTNHIELGGST